jgi:hypothetical protein
MNLKDNITTLLQHADGYTSWGSIEIEYVAKREGNTITIFEPKTDSIYNLEHTSENENLQHIVIRNILLKRRKINHIIIAKQDYGSKIKEEIPAILDDQAQLLGISIRIAYLKQTTPNVNKDYVMSAIKNRYACVDSDGLVYSIGNTLEDAFVAAWLVEKTSKAFLEAKFLGGAKHINKIEAWLMHKFYMIKYSKEAEKNK